MKRTIFLDLDGVLGNWTGHLMSRFGKTPEICNGNWEVQEVLGVTNEEIDAICNESVFWETIPLMDDAHEIYEACVTAVGIENLAILSSPGKWPCSRWAKQLWLDRHFPAVARSLILAGEKQHIASFDNILVDDSDSNCRKWRNRGGASLLVPRPWNSCYRRTMAPFAERLKGLV